MCEIKQSTNLLVTRQNRFFQSTNNFSLPFGGWPSFLINRSCVHEFIVIIAFSNAYRVGTFCSGLYYLTHQAHHGQGPYLLQSTSNQQVKLLTIYAVDIGLLLTLSYPFVRKGVSLCFTTRFIQKVYQVFCNYKATQKLTNEIIKKTYEYMFSKMCVHVYFIFYFQNCVW